MTRLADGSFNAAAWMVTVNPYGWWLNHIKPPNQNLTRFTFTGDQIHHRFWANRVAYETSTLEGRKGWSNHCNYHNLWQIHRPTRRKNLDDFLLKVFYFRKQVCNWSHSMWFQLQSTPEFSTRISFVVELCWAQENIGAAWGVSVGIP